MMTTMAYAVTVRDLENAELTTKTGIVSTPAALGRAMGLVHVPKDRYVEISAEQLGPEVEPSWPPGIVFAAGMFTQGSLDAEIDDHDWDLEIEASPQWGYVTSRADEELLEELKKDMRCLLRNEHCNGDDLMDESIEFLDYGWKFYPSEDPRRSNRVIEAYMPPVRAGEPDGLIVIQALEMDTWREKARTGIPAMDFSALEKRITMRLGTVRNGLTLAELQEAGLAVTLKELYGG